ncbi:membrane protease subunit (stomatin/prohibitin family) [Dyadobacter jejuensis]|uniref:Membrane protease subunit (Stomatin/prohibitin family) n=1 Tax=Dyadobacter jejuensis TaxID=1082580 RepID=A0A316ACL9_9BACT|nr:SPFH domain-containing protein [Dyadobacter jejuensis]PWJ55536.1 membrane protease subunit (stomatin/prohibitin family) [Dyadobacter jejuensis]
MGLFDFIRNELIEVIDWVDPTTDTLIWKFQDSGNNIKNGAKLTVRESQKVVLMNEGSFGDEYAPGLHTLSTSNMPITTTLSSWKYGFESPFKVDIYYVNTREFTNLRWGTSGPILFKDQELGPIRLKSFGNFTISVSDCKKFITKFSGTQPYIKIGQVEESLKAIVSSKLAESLAEAGISVFDLASNFTEVSQKIKPILQLEFDSYGILLEKFFIESVSLPEEVEKIIDKKTELNLLKGDLNDFTKLQGGIALEKLADNDGAANMGGLGAGVLLTNILGQSNQTNTNSADSKNQLLDLLKQLGELKNQGIISEEEFAEKKKDILSKL